MGSTSSTEKNSNDTNGYDNTQSIESDENTLEGLGLTEQAEMGNGWSDFKFPNTEAIEINKLEQATNNLEGGAWSKTKRYNKYDVFRVLKDLDSEFQIGGEKSDSEEDDEDNEISDEIIEEMKKKIDDQLAKSKVKIGGGCDCDCSNTKNTRSQRQKGGCSSSSSDSSSSSSSNDSSSTKSESDDEDDTISSSNDMKGGARGKTKRNAKSKVSKKSKPVKKSSKKSKPVKKSSKKSSKKAKMSRQSSSENSSFFIKSNSDSSNSDTEFGPNISKFTSNGSNTDSHASHEGLSIFPMNTSDHQSELSSRNYNKMRRRTHY